MSSILGGGQKSKESSTSTTQFFGPEKTTAKWQKNIINRATPSLIEQAFSGGFTPTERGRLNVRAAEDINRSATGAQSSLNRLLGRSGLAGGITAEDIGGIEANKVLAQAQVTSDIEAANRALQSERLNRLLQLATSYAPVATGQTSKSEGKSRPGVLGIF